MTQFRSKGKGKDRKAYPVNSRKPYGTSREVAYEDVQALRNKGQKARLIKTNRKDNLYAAYKGVLPVDKGEEEKKQEPEVTQSSADTLRIEPKKRKYYNAVRNMKEVPVEVKTEKGYVAVITGESRIYGLERVFLKPKSQGGEKIYKAELKPGRIVEVAGENKQKTYYIVTTNGMKKMNKNTEEIKDLVHRREYFIRKKILKE